MEKKKKRRRHRGLGFLILVMGVLIVCGVYQYREYGNIKDVMLKLIGQDPVIYQHVSEEIVDFVPSSIALTSPPASVPAKVQILAEILARYCRNMRTVLA